MTDHLTSRAQLLIDKFEEGETIAEGIANVLTHLACVFQVTSCAEIDSPPECVPVSTLDELAAELTDPTLLDRALAGDKAAALQFMQEAGFIDAYDKALRITTTTTEP